MTVKPQPLATLLNEVADVDPDGTVTVLVTDVFLAQKPEAVDTFEDPITRSNPPSALVLARADSNEVTFVLY